MVDYTDYQQRALYGAGQAAARAGQRFHMEREALERGDKDAAKYHRSRANALNRQGAYAAVRGMGGDQGANQYFATTSSGQPIRTAEGVALSSAGRDVFNQFRDVGFVEPIRQKKRYAPRTEPKGLGFLVDKIASNTMMAKIAQSILPKKKPKPDNAYYKSLWGKGLNEMYSPSGIFRSGEFLGDEKIDSYYERPYTGPKWAERFLKPFVQPRADAFGVVRDSSIPEDREFMQETPMDYTPYDEIIPPFGISTLVPEHIRTSTLNKIMNEDKGIFGRGDLPSDFDYEEDKEGRELSAKISFLESVNPHIDYDKVDPLLIDEFYEEALEMNKFMSGNIGALNPLQPDLTEK